MQSPRRLGLEKAYRRRAETIEVDFRALGSEHVRSLYDAKSQISLRLFLITFLAGKNYRFMFFA